MAEFSLSPVLSRFLICSPVLLMFNAITINRVVITNRPIARVPAGSCLHHDSCQDENDAARVIHAQHTLGLQSGLHFANPIPEKYSLPFQQMEIAINQAIQNAAADGFTGAAQTPYILSKIRLQARDTPYTGAIDCLAKIAKEKGISGWYQGMQAQITKAVLAQALLFYFRDHFEVVTR